MTSTSVNLRLTSSVNGRATDMMHIHATDLDDLWDKVNYEFLFNDEVEDFVRPGVSRHSFHNTLISDTCEIEKIHLQALGYARVKWTMLLKLYFDEYEYKMMINRLRHYREREQRGKRFVPDIGMQFRSRENRTGACLLGMTFRFSERRGWECSVFSRTNETTARWSADLIFVNRIVDAVGKELGGKEMGYFTPSDVRLYWTTGSLFQSCVTVPLYLTIIGKEKILKALNKRMEKEPDTLSDWQKAVAERYGQSYNVKYSKTGQLKYQTYKSQKRVTDAYLALHGEKESRPYVPNDSLLIPRVDLTIADNFFTKKGFR